MIGFSCFDTILNRLFVILFPNYIYGPNSLFLSLFFYSNLHADIKQILMPKYPNCNYGKIWHIMKLKNWLKILLWFNCNIFSCWVSSLTLKSLLATTALFNPIPSFKLISLIMVFFALQTCYFIILFDF